MTMVRTDCEAMGSSVAAAPTARACASSARSLRGRIAAPRSRAKAAAARLRIAAVVIVRVMPMVPIMMKPAATVPMMAPAVLLA